MKHPRPDVIIVGAGLTGCASALALSQRGLRIVMVERGTVGAFAASRAAAGILGAQLERHAAAAMQQLCVLSRDRYPGWLEILGARAAHDSEYRRCGSLRLAMTDDEVAPLQAEVSQQRAMALRAQWLSGADTRHRFPQLSPRTRGAAWYPDDAAIDPAALLKVTLAAVRAAGVEVRENIDVARVSFVGEGIGNARVKGIVARDGSELLCERVVIAAGSWSTLIEGLEPLRITPTTVVPVRGQLVQLRAPRMPIAPVVEGPGAYLSTRRDGRVLVGATVERVGFDRTLSPQAAQQLQAAAVSLLPSLQQAPINDNWCGFRAATADLLPLFDETLARGLMLCTGHYRNGVLLAPISGQVVAACVLQEAPPPTALAPFRLARLLAAD